MNAITLRETFHEFLPLHLIEERAERVKVIVRQRKLDLYALVLALVLTAGSDDGGRQADVLSVYNEEAEKGVVRGAFYAWFTTKLALLMLALLREAIKKVGELSPILTGGLAGVKDWILVDSETVTLPNCFAEIFPATSTSAGLKIHKHFSLGRNNVVDFEITPARKHDAPMLRVDESWRGKGLIVDLGYASLKLIRDCQRYGVLLIIRLKKGWKPRMLKSIDDIGELIDIHGEPVLDDLLEMRVENYDGTALDFDVAFGQGKDRVTARLVGVPGENVYHWCITLLPRETHSESQVCKLYRTRWEIEVDNRRDKGAARLDQVRRVKKLSSLMILIYASLLRTILANHLVYLDLRDRPRTRAPLHGFAVALALCSSVQSILFAIETDSPSRWRRLARAIRTRGHDPNWRRRPSHLDELRGTTAPPGRRRRDRLADSPPNARAYRRDAA